MADESPIYEHDCKACEFLGNHRFNSEDYDLYYCPQNGHPTLVARYSDDGPDYMSGMTFGEDFALSNDPLSRLHPMAEAYRRYKARKEAS